MKVCNLCGDTYRDSVDFCFNDGEVLAAVEGAGLEGALSPAGVTPADAASMVPTEALPRRRASAEGVAEPPPMPLPEDEEDDEGFGLDEIDSGLPADLYAEDDEELTATLPRIEAQPEPEASAPSSAEDLAEASMFTSFDDLEDEEDAHDERTEPLEGLPADASVAGIEAVVDELDAIEQAPAKPFSEVATEIYEDPPARDLHADSPPLPSAPPVHPPPPAAEAEPLDEAGLGGPPPDEDFDEERTLPRQPALLRGTGEHPIPPTVPESVGQTLSIGPGEGEDGAVVGVSTITPMAAHPVPTAASVGARAGRKPITPPEPLLRPPGPSGSGGPGLLMVGLGLGALALVAVVAVGIAAVTAGSRLLTSGAPEVATAAGQEGGVVPSPVEAFIDEPAAADEGLVPAMSDDGGAEGAPDGGAGDSLATIDEASVGGESSSPAPAPRPEPSASPSPTVVEDRRVTVPVAGSLRTVTSRDGMVDVYFQTEPEGATVRVDGQEVRAPGPIPLRGGKEFVYEIEIEGYEPHRNTVSVPLNLPRITASNRVIRLKPLDEEPARKPPSLSGSPIVLVNQSLYGCGLMVDGRPVRRSDVLGGTDEQVTLPFKLKALSLAEHRFQVVGAAEKCADQPEQVVDYDGRTTINLSN